MTVSSTINKSGPYNGNGVTTAFEYEFRVLDETHLTVVKTVGGAETVLTLADYAVTGVGAQVGGSVVLVAAPAAGETITIIRNAPFTQQVDLENQGTYYAETVEQALDLAAMRDQMLSEGLSRAVKIPVSASTEELDALIADIVRIGDSADNIDTVAGVSGNVSTVAGIAGEVSTVAGISGDVTTVAGVAGSVAAVAGISDDVAAVAGIEAEIIAVPAQVQAAEDAKDGAVAARDAALDAVASLNLPAIQPGDAGKQLYVKVTEDGYELDEPVTGGNFVATRTALKALDTTTITDAYLTEAGREGQFIWRTGNYSARVAADTQAGLYAKADAVPATSGAWASVKKSVSIYDFGGSPENADNLTAFNAAIASGDAHGGGELLIPRGMFTVSSKVVLGKLSKISLVGEGQGSILRGGAGYSGPTIEWGDTVTVGGDIAGRLRGFTIEKPISGTAHGISAINANIGIIEDVQFQPGLLTAISLKDCYAFRVEKCKIKQPSQFGIYSSTGAHNLVVERNSFFNTGASAINIDGGQTNLLIQGNDMEYCARLLTLWQPSQGVTFCYNYSEGTQETEFVFLGPVWGFKCDNNELSLLGANIFNPGAGGSGVTSTIDNVCGGSFKGNSQFDEKIAWGSNVWGIDVGKGKMVGAMSSLAEAPWTAPGAYASGWTQTNAGTFPVGYQRSWDGQVSLRGQVTAGASSSGQAAFTLPAQYRPSRAMTLPAVKGGGAMTYVSVFPSGVVAPAAANAEFVNLEGVRFQAAG